MMGMTMTTNGGRKRVCVVVVVVDIKKKKGISCSTSIFSWKSSQSGTAIACTTINSVVAAAKSEDGIVVGDTQVHSLIAKTTDRHLNIQ